MRGMHHSYLRAYGLRSSAAEAGVFFLKCHRGEPHRARTVVWQRAVARVRGISFCGSDLLFLKQKKIIKNNRKWE